MKAALLLIALVLVACDGNQFACVPAGEFGVREQCTGGGRFQSCGMIDVQRHTCTDGKDRWFLKK